MNAPRKFWLVLIGAILTMAVIACSCGSIIPTPTPTVPVNPMPQLEGYWLDTETNDVHVIAWQNNQYVVTAVNDDEYGAFAITSQSWNGSELTWSYKVSYNDTSVTFTTVSVSGDSLYTNWSNNTGDSGTETLQRVSSPIPQALAPQEAIPGLAGKWLDTDTEVVHTVEWQNGEYMVTSAIDPEEGSYAITYQSWSNNTLTWTYYRSSTDVSVTYETVSVSGDILNTNWTNSDGDTGTWALERVSSTTSSFSGQEAIPGLAGKWLDPDTTGTLTTIVWENGKYAITTIMNPNRSVNELSWYTWENNTLSWEYCPENMHCISSKLVSVNGDNMSAEWWWSDGGNGATTTYQRVP
ncbi:MAG: hypothetical protein ABIF04_06625 [Chloroflexota bacterium]